MAVTTGLRSASLDKLVRGTWGSVHVRVEPAKLSKAIDRKNRTVLNRTGGFGRKTMRRLFRTAPNQRKPPKRKYKRDGTETDGYKRWLMKREAEKTRKRAPYDRGGALKKLTFYAIDEESGSVLIGPAFFDGTGTVQPVTHKSGASLLDQGGQAKMLVYKKSGPEWVVRKWRPYPFREPTMEKTEPAFMKNMKDIPLK